MIKAVLQPLHRKTNPSCTLNQSTWGCGSAVIGQLFFQSRLFLRLIEMNYAIFEWKLTPAFPSTVFGLKGTSIQGHSWENMEAPSPFLIIPSQNSTDVPPLLKLQFTGLEPPVCWDGDRLSTLAIGEPPLGRRWESRGRTKHLSPCGNDSSLAFHDFNPSSNFCPVD